MRPRQSPPRLWLMTDERIGEALWPALERLPRGAGVIFRHYATAPKMRRALFDRVRRIARARGLVLVLAGTLRDAIAWRADGAHGRSPHRRAARALVRTVPVHDVSELVAARRAGADLALFSPVFATRSHDSGRVLGSLRFGLALRSVGRARPLVVALGGMDAIRFRTVERLGAYGWAAIDAWACPDPAKRRTAVSRQKRKVVPR